MIIYLFTYQRISSITTPFIINHKLYVIPDFVNSMWDWLVVEGRPSKPP